MNYANADELLQEEDHDALSKRATKVYEIRNENGLPIDPEDLPGAIALRKGIATEAVLNVFNKSTGEPLWILSKATPLHNEQGELHMVLLSSTEITIQKTAEEKIRRSEGRYRNIFENVQVSIWDEDFNTLIKELTVLAKEKGEQLKSYLLENPDEVYRLMSLVKVTNVNKASVDMFEASSKNDLRKGLHVIFDAGAVPVFVDELMAMVNKQPAFEGECMLRTVKGKKIFTLVSIALPKGDDYSSVLVTRYDVTKQKEAETALKKSEEDFRTLANNIQNLAWMADADGWVYWYNQRWYEFTGTTLEKMKGWGWDQVHHPQHKDRVIDFVKSAWKKDEPWELTFPLRRHDGVYRWFLTRAIPIKDDEGKVYRWIGTNTDIDEQKTAEEKLENLVMERTKELQRSNEDLQQFAHVASHDLKEPVRKVGTFISLLQQELDGQLPPRATQYAKKIENAALRMSAMIDGVLSYSSLGASKQKVESVDLNEVIAHIKSDLELVITQKSATIQNERLSIVEGMPVLIQQLFYNLLYNALKFSREGVAPVINITSKKEGERVQITVKDNGIGFGPTDAEAIFKPFSRLHGQQQYEGTGLGLALCKKIVERHHGTIVAEGEEGTGATFIITLPV